MATVDTAAEEIARLRGCLNDLVSIMALPALWAGDDPQRIVSASLDALLDMLRLTFVCARLTNPDGRPPIEMMRCTAPLDRATTGHEIGALLDASLADPLPWPASTQVSMGGLDLRIASARLGLQGEMGVVVAGSRRLDFPLQAERLLLDVAANQAVMGLQQARLLHDQQRLAAGLDERVAQRTRELAATNETLAWEVEERRQAEEALRESERNARLIMDGIPGLVALLGADGGVEVVNRQVLDYSGRTLEDLRQWGSSDIVHPDDLPHVAEIFSRSMTSGEPYDIVQRLRRSDGHYRWFLNSGFPLRDAMGRILRWCVLLTDIDERKRAEDALARSERHLQLIIDTIPALAWSALPDGSADYFNRHYLEFVGLSAEEARGWGWAAALHPDDVDGLAATWQRILASQAPGEAEARLRRHDGAYRWLLFRTNPLRDENGAIVRWYGINTDIEDRKRAEVELRRAYDSFADAQRLSRTGNFTADIGVDEHIWSAELYRMFELDPGTRIGVQAIRDMIHPEDLPAFDAGFTRSLDGTDFDLVFRIVPASGNLKYVHAIGRLTERIEGRPLFIGAIQDVTERRVADEALNRARSELAHVARITTLSTLTASIAHEVNQPLSGIITNAGTCLRMLDADPPDIDGARETARRTIRDGNRASSVIERLRALFSRKELTPESFDLVEATGEVIAMASSDLQRKRITVQSEFAGDLPLVTGDRVQLQQVVLNLLRNASDAMADLGDRPRQLLVRIERDIDDCVRMTVRDTGVGIDSLGSDQLFDPFYTTKQGGMGIGLSVSRSIIESHHGRIWATANEGPGATFAFAIPCRPARESPTDTKVSSTASLAVPHPVPGDNPTAATHGGSDAPGP